MGVVWAWLANFVGVVSGWEPAFKKLEPMGLIHVLILSEFTLVAMYLTLSGQAPFLPPPPLPHSIPTILIQNMLQSIALLGYGQQPKKA